MDANEHDASTIDAGVVRELRELLLTTEDLADFLTKVALLAAEQASTQDVSCGITLRREGSPVTVATSDARAAQLDEIQYTQEDGPCLTSLRTGGIVVVQDAASDRRWPLWATTALANGVRCSLAVPLRGADTTVGALNLYAGVPHAFTEGGSARAAALADEASHAIAVALRIDGEASAARHLRAALDSRSVIDQAMGVVMAQNRCDASAAFQILRSASQGRNVKLREVAEDIVAAVSRSV